MTVESIRYLPQGPMFGRIGGISQCEFVADIKLMGALLRLYRARKPYASLDAMTRDGLSSSECFESEYIKSRLKGETIPGSFINAIDAAIDVCPFYSKEEKTSARISLALSAGLFIILGASSGNWSGRRAVNKLGVGPDW